MEFRGLLDEDDISSQEIYDSQNLDFSPLPKNRNFFASLVWYGSYKQLKLLQAYCVTQRVNLNEHAIELSFFNSRRY